MVIGSRFEMRRRRPLGAVDWSSTTPGIVEACKNSGKRLDTETKTQEVLLTKWYPAIWVLGQRIVSGTMKMRRDRNQSIVLVLFLLAKCREEKQ